jgi:hypothetical protein
VRGNAAWLTWYNIRDGNSKEQRPMTVLYAIPGSEIDGIDGEPSHLGDFIQDIERPGFMPQLTSYGCRNRAAEREEAAFQKSKAAAIEKYGAVMVAAAERWIGNRFPPNMSIDPYGSLIGYYRWAYHQAVKTRKKVTPPRAAQSKTRRSISELDQARMARAIERAHDAPRGTSSVPTCSRLLTTTQPQGLAELGAEDVVNDRDPATTTASRRIGTVS